MKKLFLTFIFTAILTISGCSEQEEYGVEVTETVTETATTETVTETATTEIITETVTETTVTEITTIQTDNLQSADEIYIYDNANVLSETDFNECNEYVKWINQTFMLNTAVVTTDNLETLSPAVYAENCYNDIFDGKGSGIILLINNDTNKDYIYKHGTSENYIPEKDEKETFFYATQDIINGDFKSAILKFLSLSELCPQYVFDNGEMFIQSQIQTIENMLETNKDTANACVMTTNNITEQTNSELAMTFYKRHFPENNGKMLFIDKQTGQSIIISDGNEISADDENLIKINQLISFKDYYGAVNEYFNIIGIITEIANTTA